MARTTISVDDEVLEQARERGVTVSAVAENGLIDLLKQWNWYWTNLNQHNATRNAATTYADGVFATSAPADDDDKIEKFSGHVAAMEEGDRVFSYENDVGLRAGGIVLADGSDDPVPEEDLLLYDPSDGHLEWHVPVEWAAVLPPDRAIPAQLCEDITGRPMAASGTRSQLEPDRDRPEVLWELLKGRAGRL